MSDIPENIQCPRCGSKDVARTGQHESEYICQGRCLENSKTSLVPDEFRETYFQYSDGEYAWPMDGMYACREDELEDVRNHRKKARII